MAMGGKDATRTWNSGHRGGRKSGEPSWLVLSFLSSNVSPLFPSAGIARESRGKTAGICLVQNRAERPAYRPRKVLLLWVVPTWPLGGWECVIVKEGHSRPVVGMRTGNFPALASNSPRWKASCSQGIVVEAGCLQGSAERWSRRGKTEWETYEEGRWDRVLTDITGQIPPPGNARET